MAATRETSARRRKRRATERVMMMMVKWCCVDRKLSAQEGVGRSVVKGEGSWVEDREGA